MFCVKCGADNSDAAKFCRKCGQPMRKPKSESEVANSKPVTPPVQPVQQAPASPPPQPQAQPVVEAAPVSKAAPVPPPPTAEPVPPVVEAVKVPPPAPVEPVQQPVVVQAAPVQQPVVVPVASAQPVQQPVVVQTASPQLTSAQATPSASDSGMGIQPNIAAALSYVMGWVTGIVFLLIGGKNQFVKFHAWQSIITFGVLTILSLFFQVFSLILQGLPLVLVIIYYLAVVLVIALWIILMIKAFQSRLFKLPVIGDIAAKLAK